MKMDARPDQATFELDLDAGPVTFRMSPTRLVHGVLVSCILVELLLVLLDYHVNYGHWTELEAIRGMFNIAREDGLASWLGTTQTLLAGLTLWVLYATSRVQRASAWRRSAWLLLAIFFTYMAIDDGVQVHERLGSVFSSIEGDSSPILNAFPSYAWQVLFVPGFGAIGLAMLVFLWFELPLRSQRFMVVAALGCLAAAVGLDFIEGLQPDHPWNLYTLLSRNAVVEAWSHDRFGVEPFQTVDHFSRSLEEFLEMLANTLLWTVFLRHLVLVAGELRLRFVTESEGR